MRYLLDDRLSHLFVFSDRLAIFFLDDIVGDFSSSFSLSFLLSSPGGDWLLFASTLFPSLRLSFSLLSLLRSSTPVEVLFRSVLSLFRVFHSFPVNTCHLPGNRGLPPKPAGR